MGFVAPRSDADGAANSGGCSLLVTIGGSRRGCLGHSWHVLLCYGAAHLREKKPSELPQRKKYLGRKLRFKAPQKSFWWMRGCKSTTFKRNNTGQTYLSLSFQNRIHCIKPWWRVGRSLWRGLRRVPACGINALKAPVGPPGTRERNPCTDIEAS